MAGRGSGRGESAKVERIDQVDERTSEDRARQLAAAREMGIPESEVAVRGRGGFRQPELRTIPANISKTKADLNKFRQVDILANYVPITTQQTIIQMYRVDFSPEIESEHLMRYLFRTAARQKFDRLPMYDGVHECRSCQTLAQKVTKIEVTESNGEQKIYNVTFTHTGQTALGNEMIRTYNIHMKEFFRVLGYYAPQPGLHVHPNQSTAVGQDIMMLRGYRTAANIHDDNKMLMNFEGSHKLVQRKNVLEVMGAIRHASGGSNFQEAIRTALIGKLVVTSYNKRAYRVEDVDFSQNPRSTFQTKDGSAMVFADYFRNTHNSTIRDERQPLLTVIPNNSRSRAGEPKERDIKLVPELCNIAGLTDSQRNDNRLKMDLIRASQIAPQERVAHLREFLKSFHSNAEVQQQLSSWGYKYATEPLKLKAYIIPPTMISTQGQPMAASPESGDFNIRSLSIAPTISKLAIIIGRQDLPNKARIMSVLKQGFDSVRLAVSNVQQHDMNEGDQASNYVRQLKSLDKSVTMAIVVLPRQNKTIYDAVKKVACTEMGLITQVVTTRLLMDDRKGRSASVKIAIQVAAKVGGEPWYADIPLKGAMVCGYDTYHDTANRGRSFGAFLASLNGHYSRWFSKADQHDKLDEMSSQVATNVVEAINVYKTFNGNSLPERIIIYRDGVGEGQVAHVFNTELKEISAKIKAVDSRIRLVMIIVNKRIGARFYMRAANERFINPPPGTVIDSGVTRANRYDFYLISQSTRQGTITPTYYNIIHDEVGFGPDIHQKMALKFCFLYYNWSGSVRVPAPCQYAHKLALLCGEHLHAQPNANLSDKLHFL